MSRPVAPVLYPDDPVVQDQIDFLAEVEEELARLTQKKRQITITLNARLVEIRESCRCQYILERGDDSGYSYWTTNGVVGYNTGARIILWRRCTLCKRTLDAWQTPPWASPLGFSALISRAEKCAFCFARMKKCVDETYVGALRSLMDRNGELDTRSNVFSGVYECTACDHVYISTSWSSGCD